MLDIKTKNAIDSARDILVGKIPNPSTQVEQITLAMLYKFMDDMDQEGIVLGGKPTFFADEYEQYSWKNIMSQTISAQERYNKYTEALEKFYVHPNLPQTFKDIFKNASVPFKEPDILTMFLKEIDNGLNYEDSEQLGDAYEYLLAVLGSQGDLGQFRTPRHIINFIVNVVKPQKEDTILDPACGTAGFLISAYKYILEQNTDKTLGDKLNFDERMEVLRHITGYDIEPSMVRIAEMNMFLHGATDPDIYEYDTLTDESKWEEKFNVILANPPFMTPKGGIKPHKKFNLKANKSEILFVDYILSHLRRSGKAGIVVPEGIIANTTNAYIQLRKEMIDNGLYAVLSLHEFTFQPYSSVSTLLLFFDKDLKDIDRLYIANVQNDGFERALARNPIEKNDLPELLKEINLFKENIYNNDFTTENLSKGKIITSEDYGEEYDFHPNSYIEEDDENKKPIGEIFNIEKGSLQSTKREEGEYDFITASDDWGKHKEYTHDTEAIIYVFGAGGSLGKAHYVNGKFITSDLCFILTPKEGVKVDLKYYYAYFNKHRKKMVKLLARGVNKKAINKTRFSNYKVDLPEIDKQIEIGKKVEETMNEIKQLKAQIKEKQDSMANML